MSDKRKVTTDALDTLGFQIDETCKRDAIHLAVEPCIAGETLYPGFHIGIVDGKATTKAETKLGIVDPFLNDYVPEGKMFWLIVYPRTITSLRHVWEHPYFTETVKELTKEEKSKLWIKDFSAEVGLKYDILMEGAAEWIRTEDYLCFGGLLEGERVPDDFWEHYEIVTGTTVAQENRGSFFTCSC